MSFTMPLLETPKLASCAWKCCWLYMSTGGSWTRGRIMIGWAIEYTALRPITSPVHQTLLTIDVNRAASSLAMDESNSAKLLNEINLRRLQDEDSRRPAESLSIRSSSVLPILTLSKVKRRISNFLWIVQNMKADGDPFYEAVDVYLTDLSELLYRGPPVPESDLQDPRFWDAKLQRLMRDYGADFELGEAKERVYNNLRGLDRFGGPEGQQITADYELYCDVGQRDVRYRGNDPKPALQDPAYWNRHHQYLDPKLRELRRKQYPCRDAPYIYKPPTTQEEKRRNENAALAVSETPISNGPSIRATVADDDESSSCRSEELVYYNRWREAYIGVYNRMAALWDLGGEGREIVKNDELRIVGRHDVRFRRSRGPQPNLADPTYWESKWEYFTDKYINLIRRMQDSSKVLSHLELDPYELPIPKSETGDLSPPPSSVASVQTSPELAQAREVRRYKRLLYDVLREDFFLNEGRSIIEADDIYVAGYHRIHYKSCAGPQPNLHDPQYWRDKYEYFLERYYTSLPEEELMQPDREFNMTQVFDFRDEMRLGRVHTDASAPAPGSLDPDPEDSITVHYAAGQRQEAARPADPTNKENVAPILVEPVPQVEQLPRAPTRKRKRPSHSDDTDSAEEQSRRPRKRIRTAARQASEARASATRSTHATAPAVRSPTQEPLVSPPRIAEQLSKTPSRKRHSYPDDTNQAEERSPRPTKRVRTEARQASEARAPATRSPQVTSPLAKPPTQEHLVSQPRIADHLPDHGEGQSSSAPTKRIRTEESQASEARAPATGSPHVTAPLARPPTQEHLVSQPRVVDQLSDHREGQASSAPAPAAEPDDRATRTPSPAKRVRTEATKEPRVSQLRIADQLSDHGEGQSSLTPAPAAEPEDRATQTPPKPRKRQRKTYEKQRTSRRLAGQAPEFGLLPARGEEPQPYQAPPSSRRVTNTTTGKIASLGPRSDRVTKKPAAAKTSKISKSQKTSKPDEGIVSRPRRAKRN
ncbi:hypothetical protein F4808DRAFT_467388 [Astrocystis sublimbata]|nr:hypothetical protein F4808DRAFT_467388 [Astrocystis sublimbata]